MRELLGYTFQHEEIGIITFVDTQQVKWGFEDNNPRLIKCDAIYKHSDEDDKILAEKLIEALCSKGMGMAGFKEVVHEVFKARREGEQ